MTPFTLIYNLQHFAASALSCFVVTACPPARVLCTVALCTLSLVLHSIVIKSLLAVSTSVVHEWPTVS